MNFFKRWTLSLATSFENVMNQVENHEALIGCAIREMKEAHAKARGKLLRVKQDGDRMAQRLRDLEEEIGLWNERALRSAAGEREKALECLKRKRQCERERTFFKAQHAEHEALSADLNRDVRAIEERIDELTRKRNAMAARECRAQAMQAGDVTHLNLIGEIDEIFERWETKLFECEAVRDHFAESVAVEEETDELEKQLEELLTK